MFVGGLRRPAVSSSGDVEMEPMGAERGPVDRVRLPT